MLLLFFLLTTILPQPKDYKQLNKQAVNEYQIPIRPGYEGRNPFWNTYAKKFIYAPAFDFNPINGAEYYLFSVTLQGTIDNTEVRGDDDGEALKASSGKKSLSLNGHQTWTFKASSPKSNLSPIWKSLPVGDMHVKVEAYDKDDRQIGVAGERSFFRDFPFSGPYHPAIRPYEEAARIALLYIHEMPEIQSWKDSVMPNMNYKHNTYANKIIGNTISAEILVAKLFPEYREDALRIARNAAQFLIDHSRPEGEKLAFFPPTYYGNLVASKRNQGLTMTMDACYAANAFLDIYDMTKEDIYLQQALKIINTYSKLQDNNGMIPIKVKFETGEAVNPNGALQTPLMALIVRIQKHYAIHQYDQTLAKAERWMNDIALKSFEMKGQFEDMSVNVKPYENLTNSTASAYASYLLSKEKPSRQNIADAFDLIRFSEDQFVHWDCLPSPNGIRRMYGPCVFEQYHYNTPVDASSCNVANAMLDYYEATGDRLALAKAVALINELIIAQDIQTGKTSTTIDYREPFKEKGRVFWVNCSLSTIKAWLRLSAMTAR